MIGMFAYTTLRRTRTMRLCVRCLRNALKALGSSGDGGRMLMGLLVLEVTHSR